MTYLQKKKLAFMSIVNQIKGFVRTVSGVPPITLESCVDDKSVINYQIYGNSVQDGEPSPDNPVEVVSVGEKTKNLYNPNDLYIPVEAGEYYQIEFLSNSTQFYKTISLYDENKVLVKDVIKYAYMNSVYSKWIIKPQVKGYLYVYAHITPSVPIMVTKGLTVTLTDAQNTSLDTNQFVRVDNSSAFPNYEPYGYKIPITASGLNLFNINNTSGFTSQYGGLTNTIDNNVLTVKCSVSSRGGTLTLGKFKAGTYYIGVKVLSSNGSTISVYKKEGWTRLGNANTVITITEELTLQLYTAFSSSVVSQYTDIQVVETNKVTDYEPYHEPITTNIYLDEPLRAIGDYKDYIDFESGKLVRNIKKKRVDKAAKLYTYQNMLGFYTSIDFLDANYSRIVGLSNRENEFAYDLSHNTLMWIGVNSPILYWIGVLDKLGFTTLDEINTWLIENETWIYWKAKSPTEETIDLSNLPTFKGTTIYTIGTTIQPSNMDVTYYSTEKE